MSFTPAFLDELRGRLTLSELIGRRVALKRKGHESSGLCPFHNEKSPSFTVNDRKGFFHCFGCGAHGDAIGFVMRAEGLGFPDAVEKLAQETGLPLPVSSPAERQQNEQRDDARHAVELAATWFERQLRMPAGREALEYLHGRGLDDAAIERFRLGYAPDNREALMAALRRDGISVETIVLAGLAIQPEDGRNPYDRFRGRVMFPIADRRGRTIAFGGRVLGSGEPKYLNSPETPLFHKGANLYCLHLAREAAFAGRPLIVAEGYMDAIALHVAGFAGAVAPLGTALTEEQLAELWKLSDEPLLCFDGDNAGRRAAFRAAERALPILAPGKSLRFVSLPAGEDPDSLIRGQGKDAMSALLDSARPLAEMVWELETAGTALDTPERRAKVRAALRQRAAQIRDQTVREQYLDDFETRARATLLSSPRFSGSPRPNWPARGQRPEVPGAFRNGTAIHRASHDLDPSRRERLLLGLPIMRPDLLADLSEDIVRLDVSATDLERLRAALLSYVSRQHDSWDTAELTVPGHGFDRSALEAYLQLQGVGAVAQASRREAEQWLKAGRRPDDAASLLLLWHDVADMQNKMIGDPLELRRAEEAYREDPSPANFDRLRAIKEQMFRSRGAA